MNGRTPRSGRRFRRARGDGGAASTELVLITPVLIAFFSLVVLAGRLTDAKGDVVSAASDAARAASLQPTFGAAHAAAQDIASDSVADEGIECAGGVQVDRPAPGFERAPPSRHGHLGRADSAWPC